MAVDISKLFNADLPAKMAQDPTGASAIGVLFQIGIGGVGEWLVDAKSSTPHCEQGYHENRDCMIIMASEDFQHLWDNPQDTMQLFFAGKVKVTGNPTMAMKLSNLMAFAKG